MFVLLFIRGSPVNSCSDRLIHQLHLQVSAVVVLSVHSFLSLSTLALNKVFSHFLFLDIDMLILIQYCSGPPFTIQAQLDGAT